MLVALKLLHAGAVLTWVHAAMGALDIVHQSSDDAPSESLYKRHKDVLLKRKPFTDMKYFVFDECTWGSSVCAAITHYAFLENLYSNSTDNYDFKLWDFHAFGYQRWSINTIMFRGDDLNAESISGDDEQSISVDLPQELGQHCGAVGQALVVHLAYNPQRNADIDNLLPHFEQLAVTLTGDLLPETFA